MIDTGFVRIYALIVVGLKIMKNAQILKERPKSETLVCFPIYC